MLNTNALTICLTAEILGRFSAYETLNSLKRIGLIFFENQPLFYCCNILVSVFTKE